ncbi:MAG: DUF4244 domain-containing protein [Actinomycetaceae bacterium]|nr:DUF4244 domain-containing protein [Actinomycetaceae bacterium]
MKVIDDITLAALRAQRAGEIWIDDQIQRFSPKDQGDSEEGSTTVEYAIGAVAAAGFAGLLLAVLKSGPIKTALQGIIEKALAL